MRRRNGLSFRGMFCLVMAVMVVFASSVGANGVADLCVRLAIPDGKFDGFLDGATGSSVDSLLSVSDNNQQNTVKKTDSTVLAKNLAYTPDDIKKLVDSAKANESKDKRDGDIVEYFYDKSSATDVSGDILVRNASDKSIDIDGVLKQEPDLKIENRNEPTVLIFHTHTTESYQMLDRDFYAVGHTSRSFNSSENMVRVGTEIAAQLQGAGFKVIHDKEIYDEKYSGAYDRSGKAIDEYLKKYPSIQVILDIHRDAIQDNSGTKTKPVATINGKKAAQIMIISGCEGDGVTDFPDWQYNLRFALRLQKKCAEMYQGLARPLLFDNRRYNMYKGHCSLLVEMGSDANTLDEAAYSGRLLGDVLSELLEEYTA